MKEAPLRRRLWQPGNLGVKDSWQFSPKFRLGRLAEAERPTERRSAGRPVHHISFSANCSCRLLAAVLLMVLNSPNDGAPPDVASWKGLGMEKIGWLRKLKASKRNCTLKCSVMFVVFIALKSKLTYFGPRRTLRPASPNTS